MMLASHRRRLEVVLECARTGADTPACANGGCPPPPRLLALIQAFVLETMLDERNNEPR